MQVFPPLAYTMASAITEPIVIVESVYTTIGIYRSPGGGGGGITDWLIDDVYSPQTQSVHARADY